jgi:hypothetical protein
MPHESVVDPETGRKFYLDYPDDLGGGEQVTFLLSLHGGGAFGAWQRLYFPAFDFAQSLRLVIATPTAATAEPMRRWMPEADDQHLRNVVEMVTGRFGAASISAFWLAGHSLGGFTANRLVCEDEFFACRADGYLSLSGGRLGPAGHVAGFGPPVLPGEPPRTRLRFAPPPLPDADLSFIFAIGEHEIDALPETSPWADRYGAGPRVRLPDVVDTEAGQVHDKLREGHSSPSWGLLPRPGVARVYAYADAAQDRVIADVVRLGKGHTEGLEPNITRTLLELIVAAPGGKLQAAAAAAPAAAVAAAAQRQDRGRPEP